jgi:hypothetical protein
MAVQLLFRGELVDASLRNHASQSAPWDVDVRESNPGV